LFAKDHGSIEQYRRALEVQLPSSPFYEFLEGRLPRPEYTYTKLAELTEAIEQRKINKEIGERKTRLGARIDQVTTQVKREVYSESPLEGLYQSVIDWTHDDEVRRTHEEKLLQRAYDTLLVLATEEKLSKLEQVLQLARGMVIIKHPYLLAWRIEIEFKDFEQADEWDAGLLLQFVKFFPDQGASSVIKGYFTSELSPFPAFEEDLNENDESVTKNAFSTEERLLIMTVRWIDCSGVALLTLYRKVWMTKRTLLCAIDLWQITTYI
jgi:superkiller protein 3